MQGPSAKEKAGYAKIKHCCGEAARDGYDFVWIDTCCIDKTSSAELSEAINSIYQWYKQAKTCYAYLSDVEPLSFPQFSHRYLTDIEATNTYKSALFKDSHKLSKDLESTSFHKSRWFTRGWTLQELIAPAKVEFYARDWSPFGTKADLNSIPSSLTGIDEDTLTDRDVREVSVAKRMSWASKRVTTSTEDIAYCLVGIFGVNLPLLYGEGERSFVRLREEIMKNSDD